MQGNLHCLCIRQPANAMIRRSMQKCGKKYTHRGEQERERERMAAKKKKMQQNKVDRNEIKGRFFMVSDYFSYVRRFPRCLLSCSVVLFLPLTALQLVDNATKEANSARTRCLRVLKRNHLSHSFTHLVFFLFGGNNVVKIHGIICRHRSYK